MRLTSLQGQPALVHVKTVPLSGMVCWGFAAQVSGLPPENSSMYDGEALDVADIVVAEPHIVRHMKTNCMFRGINYCFPLSFAESKVNCMLISRRYNCQYKQVQIPRSWSMAPPRMQLRSVS
jgi:hypothetical protein